MSALGGWSWPSGWAVRGSLGAVLGGTLEPSGAPHKLGAGVVGGVSASRQVTFGAWFVAGSLGLSASRATTTEDVPGAASQSILATDARIGVIAGRTFGSISPYLLGRGFGGPVRWTIVGMDVTGSDVHHYQLGAGASLTLAGRWSVLVDVAALGERSASLGASLRL